MFINQNQQNIFQPPYGFHRSKFIILAISSKIGGKCVGAIKLSDENGYSTCQLVRLVTDDPNTNGAVPSIWFDNNGIEILDMVECWVRPTPTDIQPENYLIFGPANNSPWLSHQKFDQFSSDQYNMLTNIINCTVLNTGSIFYNNNRRLHPDLLKQTPYPHSLELRFINHIQLYHNNYNKTRADFDYNNEHYSNISVTDSRYYHYRQLDLYNCFALFSIGNLFDDGFHYKILASIITTK